METYNFYVNKKDECEKMLSKYDTLINLGIPKGKVQFYVSPTVSSGYSMGELVEVYCNGVLIEKIDNRKQYAKSCKWRGSEKHGKIVLHFNKTDLKKYVNLYETRRDFDRRSNDYKLNNGYHELFEKCNELVKKAFVEKDSVVRKLSF